jgi:hypothetical protein
VRTAAIYSEYDWENAAQIRTRMPRLNLRHPGAPIRCGMNLRIAAAPFNYCFAVTLKG